MFVAATIHLEPNWTFFPLLVIFIVVFIAMKLGVFGPILKLMEKRRETTEGEVLRAQHIEKSAHDQNVFINNTLNDAFEQCSKLRIKAREEAQKKAHTILDEGLRARDRILAEGLREQERLKMKFLEERESTVASVTKVISSYALMKGGDTS